MKKKCILMLTIFCWLSSFAIDQTSTITSGGIQRSFVFHANATTLNTIPQNLPLMIVMHGDGGTGSGIKGYTGFDAVANANNFIVVYPNAINSSWNRYIDNVPGDAGLNNPNAPDDVQFISDLIDHFCVTYQINPNKVYASGHSAGGFMAYNLAIRLPSKIAAFAPVAASLWGDTAFVNNYFSNSFVPVPIYHVHGDVDNTVNYPDPNHIPDAWSEYPLSNFGFSSCSNPTYTSTIDIVSQVKKLTFCNTNKEVFLIRIVGNGHGWPAVSGYNAASGISLFCLSYSLNLATNCANLSTNNYTELENSILVFPNPSQGTFSIKTSFDIKKVTVFDFLGKEINLLHSNNDFQIVNSILGTYFVKIELESGQQIIKRVIIN